MLNFPLPADQIINRIVYAVSQRILGQLQSANNSIECINFMFGHQIEVKNVLQEMVNDPSYKFKRFPLVFLQADIRSDAPKIKNLYADLTLQLFILMPTDPTWIAEYRIKNNFIPILRPIYQTLIQEIWRSGYFWVQNTMAILGHDQEHLFWGKDESGGGLGKNIFNEYVDCIEIKNLKLTICKPGNSCTENTYNQFIQFYLMYSKLTLTVGAVTDNSITNYFFSNVITEITTDKQDYIAGIDFTQNITSMTITGININFYTGQVLIAKR